MHLSTHKWVEDAIRLTDYCKPTMSLSRKRRRKQEQRRHHRTRPAPRTPPEKRPREGEAAQLSPEGLFELRRALDEPRGPTPEETADPRDVGEAPPTAPSSAGLQEAPQVDRLAYTRRQAAEALGVSISTIDRRVVPAIETVKTPWGQRLIPADELRRFLRKYREPAARGRPARRPPGRPPTVPHSVVERIRLEYARGRGFSEIARRLTAEGVPTAHGGRKWWPSTVRSVLASRRPSGAQPGAHRDDGPSDSSGRKSANDHHAAPGAKSRD